MLVSENGKLLPLTSDVKVFLIFFQLVVVGRKDLAMEMVTAMVMVPEVEMAHVAVTRSIQEIFAWTVLKVTSVP